MVILLGSVTEVEKHVSTGLALELGQFSGQSGLRIQLGGQGSVAIDPFRT